MDNELTQFPHDEEALWAAVGGLEAAYLAETATAEEGRRTTARPEPGAAASRGVHPSDLPEEVRGLWVSRWDYRRPEDIRVIAERAAAAHFNLLFFQVRGNADAYYRSRLEPWAERLTGTLGQDPGWDPLQVAIDEAHAVGLEIHAWINVYPTWLGETPPLPVKPEPMLHRFNRLYGDNWVLWNRDGQPMRLNKHYLWANPAHWAVVEHVAAVCHDLVSRYYLDGIHLDNVRYAGWQYSYDPLTLDRLTEAQQLEPELTQAEWQRRQVSRLVASVRAVIDRLKPGLLLSAAVWPVYRNRWPWWSGGDGYDGYCQDSVGWLREQLMDAICPMLYLSSIIKDDDQFVALLKDLVEQAGRSPVYAGISASYSDFAILARRIDLARQVGAAGVALFSYGQLNRRDYWQALRQGPFATPALALPPAPVRERLADRL